MDRPVNVETTVLLKGPTIKRSGSPPSVKHDCMTVLIRLAVNARWAVESVRAVEPTVTGSAPVVLSKLVFVSNQQPIIPEVRAVVALPLFRAWLLNSAASTERLSSLVRLAI